MKLSESVVAALAVLSEQDIDTFDLIPFDDGTYATTPQRTLYPVYYSGFIYENLKDGDSFGFERMSKTEKKELAKVLLAKARADRKKSLKKFEKQWEVAIRSMKRLAK